MEEQKEIAVPWDYFDYIGVAGCTKYRDRFRAMSKQLREYGCTSAHWRFDFQSPFNDAAYRATRKWEGLVKNPSVFSLTLNHYGNVKTAYELGCERALFLEDDTVFLKDRKLLSEIISSTPVDADVALYDWSVADWRHIKDIASRLEARLKPGEHWVKANNVDVNYFSMVGLSRRGMGWLIDKIERSAAGQDGGLRDIDAYFCPKHNSGINVYVAFPHAGVQRVVDSSVHAKKKPYHGFGVVKTGDYDSGESHMTDMAAEKRAFAIYAKGDRFNAYKNNMMEELRRIAPDIDIVEVDMSQAQSFLSDLPEPHRPYFARLTIPLIEQFKQYDKVAWVDVDVDIVSARFKDVFDQDTGTEGFAAAADRFQKRCKDYMRSRYSAWDNPVYFNSGVLLMDMRKIDRNQLLERLRAGIKDHLRKKFSTWDQDLINAYFKVAELDKKFNGQWEDGQIHPDGAWIRHYLGGGKSDLDKIIAQKNEDAVDAVFVIGTGTKDNNEELRYALRSIDRYCPFIRDVYICGTCPSWVDRSAVKFLPWPDRFSHAKDANIIDKLRHACEQAGMARRVLFCSDDQFVTRTCTWNDFAPRWLRKYDPRDTYYTDRKRVWHTRLGKTLSREYARRKEGGLDLGGIYYWEPHIWSPIDRDLFLEYATWCDYEHRDDTITQTGYYNFVGTEGKKDYDHTFMTGKNADCPTTTHVAYNDEGYKCAMHYLHYIFPSPSRFEAKTSSSHRKVKVPDIRPVPVGDWGDDADPAPASSSELAEVHGVVASVRDMPAWSPLLGEVSRAEELRLFGVRGWRTVWKDIISRWREATHDGAAMFPVERQKSADACRVVADYMSDPESVRTIRFGSAASKTSAQTACGKSSQASDSDRMALHGRVLASLRGRAQ